MKNFEVNILCMFSKHTCFMYPFFFLLVPFTAALKFVKERSYPLHLGYIRLPLNDLKSLSVCMFEESLIQGINQAKSRSKKFEDSRMLYIRQKIMVIIDNQF